MSRSSPVLPSASVPRTDHLLGEYRGREPGPTLVVAAGIHGNEPSGIVAFRRVLDRLERRQPAFRGRLLGIAGNLPALAVGERFVDLDLNRMWLPDRVEELRDPSWKPTASEDRQQAEILATLDELVPPSPEPLVFLDLHTSSARGKPFVCIGDTLRNRKFAMQFPVPIILGLEEQIDGALLEYVNNLGHVTVGVEAGKHDHPDSVDHHEAFVGLALLAARCLAASDLPEASAFRERLRTAARGIPPVLEVRYRHPVSPGDGFEMEPGYSNFQPVERDELLARDAEREIRALERGRVLLPLYQGLGSDGFFLVREVRPLWLRVSALLRRLHLDRVAHWLPGVRRDPRHHETLVVDPRVARWLTVEVFHLLGFRKERSRGGKLLFTRRRET